MNARSKRAMFPRKCNVVVLGWWSDFQERIAFVRLLRNELGLSLGEAKQQLDHQLTTGEPIVLRLDSRERALDLGSQIAACGAEVRILSGTIDDPMDSQAQTEYERLLTELSKLLESATTTAAERRVRAANLCPELRLPTD
jgi:DNA-binding transcriptional MerR regulator